MKQSNNNKKCEMEYKERRNKILKQFKYGDDRDTKSERKKKTTK